jgi:hypothetical protein
VANSVGKRLTVKVKEANYRRRKIKIYVAMVFTTGTVGTMVVIGQRNLAILLVIVYDIALTVALAVGGSRLASHMDPPRINRQGSALPSRHGVSMGSEYSGGSPSGPDSSAGFGRQGPVVRDDDDGGGHRAGNLVEHAAEIRRTYGRLMWTMPVFAALYLVVAVAPDHAFGTGNRPRIFSYYCALFFWWLYYRGAPNQPY